MVLIAIEHRTKENPLVFTPRVMFYTLLSNNITQCLLTLNHMIFHVCKAAIFDLVCIMCV